MAAVLAGHERSRAQAVVPRGVTGMGEPLEREIHGARTAVSSALPGLRPGWKTHGGEVGVEGIWQIGTCVRGAGAAAPAAAPICLATNAGHAARKFASISRSARRQGRQQRTSAELFSSR